MPNSQIPLQTQLPQARSPLQTLGALAQLREARDMQESRDLLNEQRRRALDDDQAIRSALQQHETPDDAVTTLYRAGRASAAGSLSKSLGDWRKEQGGALKEQLANSETKLKLSTQIAQGITDEPSFQRGKKAIASLLGADMAANLGDEYDQKR